MLTFWWTSHPCHRSPRDTQDPISSTQASVDNNQRRVVCPSPGSLQQEPWRTSFAPLTRTTGKCRQWMRHISVYIDPFVDLFARFWRTCSKWRFRQKFVCAWSCMEDSCHLGIPNDLVTNVDKFTFTLSNSILRKKTLGQITVSTKLAEPYWITFCRHRLDDLMALTAMNKWI